MDMKIGILTFHTADNYGAVLQAYALKEFIASRYSSHTEIIDFHTTGHDIEHYKLFKKRHPNPLKNIILNLFVALHYLPLKRKHRLFETFRNNSLSLSKRRYDTEESLKSHVYDYDVYITGSDQVFNPHVPYSDTYYLGFTKNSGVRKISYAGSFGIASIPETEKPRIKDLLSDFDFISCREENGLAILNELGIKDADFVCDPVFLLPEEEWSQVIPQREITEDYIFVYDLNGGVDLIVIASKIQEESGIKKIICATANTMQYSKNVDWRYDVGPLQMLSFIKNAKYVVTDSFHGSSLSLVLNTKVLIYIATPSTSSRLVSLTSRLGISSQLIEDSHSFCLGSIDFCHYTEKLLEYVAQSVEYLDESLSS
jgi:hypothetical protein